MAKHTIVLDIAAAGILTALLHHGAIANAWYWSFWWMDVVMHFLGGLFVGLVVLWVIARFSTESFSKKKIFTITLVGVLIVSVGWEVFEYVTGVFLAEEFLPDTFYDLVLDTLGGVVAYWSRYKIG